VKPCNFLNRNKNFGGMCRLCPQGRNQNIPQKGRYISKISNGGTFQNKTGFTLRMILLVFKIFAVGLYGNISM
jgi:hypothetical protein